MPVIRQQEEIVRISQDNGYEPSPVDHPAENEMILSPMDGFCSNFGLNILYVFPTPPPSQNYDMNKVRQAFGRALALYPFLSGRFAPASSSSDPTRPDALKILLTDEGCRFITASWSDATLEDVLPREPIRDMNKLSRDLLPPSSEGKYVFAIQFTLLRDGAMALGIATSHSIFDGEGIFRFIDVLSRCYRDGAHIPNLEHDRSRLFPQSLEGSSITHPEYTLKTITPPAAGDGEFRMPACSHKVFHVSREFQSELKKAAQQQLTRNGDTDSFVSHIDCLQAHILSLATMARDIGPETEEIHHNTGVNGRKRFNPPISSWYSGNAIFNALSSHKTTDLLRYRDDPVNSLTTTARKIRMAISQMTPEYLEDAKRLVSTAPGGPTSVTLRANYFLGNDFLITSWVGMGLRDADFGFGQPRFAGPPYIPVLDGFTIFADAEYGTPGSIDVIIGLRSEHMVEFEALFAEPWLERLKVAV